MPYCEECGAEHKLEDRFCESCGFSLSQQISKKKKEWLIVTAGISILLVLILFLIKGISLLQCSMDVDNIQMIKELYSNGDVNSVALSLNGKRLIGRDSSGAVTIWDTDRFEILNSAKRYPYSEGFAFVALSFNGRYLATAGYKDIGIWNVKSFKELYRFDEGNHNTPISCIALNTKGKLLASGYYDATIKVWSVNTFKGRKFLKQIKLSGKKYGKNMRYDNQVCSLAFSPDGRYLAGGSSDGEFRIWDTKTFKGINFYNPTQAWSVAFSPDGKYLAVGGSRNIIIWEKRNFERYFKKTKEDSFSGHFEKLEGHTKAVKSIVFDSAGEYLISGSTDGTVKIWDMKTFKEVKTLIDCGEVNSLAISRNGRYLASGNGSIKVWKVGRKLHPIKGR